MIRSCRLPTLKSRPMEPTGATPMTTTLMQIAGMTCAHCETTVTEVLTAAGAADVRADWTTGLATFAALERDRAALQRAVEDAGYRVMSIGDTTREYRRVDPAGGGAHDFDLIVLGAGSAAFA